LVQRRRIQEVDAAFWERVMNVNVISMLWAARGAVPWLEKAGQAGIVNLASLAGRKGGPPGSLVYSTAKGAVVTWTR
jgi:3-oxoacyl-[acyl-carrier protein] reductase